MAITNAQQYQQLVNKPADGKRPGYRGDAAYRSRSAQSSPSAGGQGNVSTKSERGDGPKGDTKPDRPPSAGGLGGADTPPTKQQIKTARKEAKKSDRSVFLNRPKTRKRKPFLPFGMPSIGLGTLIDAFGIPVSMRNRAFFADPNFKSSFGILGPKKNVLQGGKFKFMDAEGNLKTLTSSVFDEMSPEEQDEVFKQYMDERLSGKVDAYGNVKPGYQRDALGNLFETGGVDAQRSREDELLLLKQQLANVQKPEPEPATDPTFYRFMNQGGRVGFKGGADMATVAGDTRPARRGSVNVGAGGATFNPGGKDEGPDKSKTTFEQDLMSRRASRGLETGSPTFTERAKEGLESIMGLILAGIIPPAGAEEMSDEELKQLKKDAGVTAGADAPPAGTLPRFLADDYKLYKSYLSPSDALDMTIKENVKDYPELGTEDPLNLMQRFERGIADPNLEQVSLPGQPRIMAADGGIMDLARQEMFLGGIAKSLKKGVKSISRSLKKVAKSPIGKAALLAGLGSYGLKLGPLKGLSGSGFLLKDAAAGFGLDNIGMKALLGTTGLTYLLSSGDEEKKYDPYLGPEIDPRAYTDPYGITFRRFAADGGSMKDKEPVAKKTMPLLDMDGKEKDYRETGGFVDMGRMERADDVPARLSKNEFVFTADAVRNAGEGDIDKGAEVMYNMMKNLEAGGEVSEESQGLTGAREMFQTSKRLEEVL